TPSRVCAPSLHDALPISVRQRFAEEELLPVFRLVLLDEAVELIAALIFLVELFEVVRRYCQSRRLAGCELRQKIRVRTLPAVARSEEHTSELQSPDHLVC